MLNIPEYLSGIYSFHPPETFLHVGTEGGVFFATVSTLVAEEWILLQASMLGHNSVSLRSRGVVEVFERTLDY